GTAAFLRDTAPARGGDPPAPHPQFRRCKDHAGAWLSRAGIFAPRSLPPGFPACRRAWYLVERACPWPPWQGPRRLYRAPARGPAEGQAQWRASEFGKRRRTASAARQWLLDHRHLANRNWQRRARAPDPARGRIGWHAVNRHRLRG